jgi:hypothetical protein
MFKSNQLVALRFLVTGYKSSCLRFGNGSLPSNSGQIDFQSSGRKSLRLTCPFVVCSIDTHLAGAIGRWPESHWLNIPGLTSILFAKSDWEILVTSRYLFRFILSSNLAKLNDCVNSHAKYKSI